MNDNDDNRSNDMKNAITIALAALCLAFGLALAVSTQSAGASPAEYDAAQAEGAKSLCQELGGEWRATWCDIDLR